MPGAELWRGSSEGFYCCALCYGREHPPSFLRCAFSSFSLTVLVKDRDSGARHVISTPAPTHTTDGVTLGDLI